MTSFEARPDDGETRVSRRGFMQSAGLAAVGVGLAAPAALRPSVPATATGPQPAGAHHVRASKTLLGLSNVAPPAWHPKFVNPLPQPGRIDMTAGGDLTLEMRQSRQWLGFVDGWGRRLETDVWGYNQPGEPAQHLGPTIITRSGVPIDVSWNNRLDHHLFPDLATRGHHAPKPPNGGVATVVHLHGGHTEPDSDGYPSAWYTADNQDVGPHYIKPVYHYDNTQNAATLWYHDHALGITRLNVYAGLAGQYWVRDDVEAALDLPAGDYERELIVQDVLVKSDATLDRGLEFPAFFGNYMVVNGMTWPYLDVEPRAYRFRLLNACDSRFLRLSLDVPWSWRQPTFTQIGTEGGLVEEPVELDEIMVGPGERYDLVIDFSRWAGRTITMENSAFILPSLPNIGATREIMQFKVGRTVSEPDRPLPIQLRDPIPKLGEPVKTRRLLVAQALDKTSPAVFIDLLGTLDEGMMRWHDPVTEVVNAGDIEVWELYNTSIVEHVIHVHQIDFEILDRQPIKVLESPLTYHGSPTPVRAEPVGSPTPPRAWEHGEKDSVIIPAFQMARIKVRFDLVGDYVWHCHLLTHEDHDMMRPLKII